jgi:hypothetical protein
MLSHSSCVLFPQLLSRGTTDGHALLVEVTRAWEATTAIAFTRVVPMLTARTFAREATVVWDSTNLRVKGGEDWTPMMERETLERVSRAEAKNGVVLAFAHEDADGFVWKIALLEDSLRQSVRLGKCLRGTAKDNTRSSPFYIAGIPSCVMPSLVPHGRGMTYLRGWGLWPSTILK